MVDLIQKQGLDSTIEIGSHSINWDFEYVANDSLRLQSGYGNASNELDFSRASPSDYINKSKFLSSKLQDNELITEDGISLYAGFTNRLNYQSDLSNVAWIKVGCSITKDSTGSLFNDGNAKSEHYAKQIDSGVTYSRGLSVKAIVKDVTGTLSVRLRLADRNGSIGDTYFNFSSESFYYTSSNLTSRVRKLQDGIFELDLHTESGSFINPELGIYSLEEGTVNTVYPGSGGEFYVIRTQMADSASFLAISQVADTQVARNEDILSFKSMNNIPSSFSNLTIEIGTSVPVSSGDYQNLLRADVLSNYFWMRRENSSEDIRLYSPSGTINFGSPDDEKHRFTITFDGSAIKSFVDGALINTISSSVSPISTLDYNGNIHIGGSPFGGQNLNSEVKYFRIKHSALTDEQVAARGGY